MSTLLTQHDALAATVGQSAAYVLRTGRILREGANSFIVLVQTNEHAMRCAVSCLLVPEPGDLVLVADNSSEFYILAVLERPGSAPVVLRATTPSKTMVLAAQKLLVRADAEIEIAAPQTNIRGGRLTVAVEALAFVAKLFTQTLERWQTSAQKVDIVATDIATKAARRVAIVDEVDVLEAGAILQKIEAAAVTNAQAVVISADEDLRLDGTRVTVG
jgi:uncharacterized protein DUF3540